MPIIEAKKVFVSVIALVNEENEIENVEEVSENEVVEEENLEEDIINEDNDNEFKEGDYELEDKIYNKQRTEESKENIGVHRTRREIRITDRFEN